MAGITKGVKKVVQDVGSGLGLIEGTTAQAAREAQAQALVQQQTATSQRATDVASQVAGQAAAAAKRAQDEIAARQAAQKTADDERAAEIEAAKVTRNRVRGGRRSLLQFADTGALGVQGGLSKLLGGGQ